MEVTVIIPTYKRLGYLAEAIASVLGQTYSNWTCIVVNDRPEDSNAIAKLIADLEDPRLILINCETSLGGNGARNRGIEAAKGDIIAFLDDDDLWLPDKLEKHLKKHRENPQAGIIFSGVIQEWDGVKLPSKTTLATLPNEPIIDAMSRGIFCPHSTSGVTVRRECFTRCGMFDRDLISFQDWDMWFKIAQIYPFDCVTEALIIFRQHLGDRTSKSVDRRLQGLEQIISKWGDKIENPQQFKTFFTKEVYVTHINKSIVQKERGQAIKYWRKLLKISSTNRDFLQLTKLAILFLLGIDFYKPLLQGFRYLKLNQKLE